MVCFMVGDFGYWVWMLDLVDEYDCGFLVVGFSRGLVVVFRCSIRFYAVFHRGIWLYCFIVDFGFSLWLRSLVVDFGCGLWLWSLVGVFGCSL